MFGLPKSVVAIVKGDGLRRMTVEALALIKAQEAVSPHDRVLIKPNYVLAKPPESGVTTDPRVVEGVIDFLQGHGVRDITVGEGGVYADTADEAFKRFGLTEMAAERGVRLVNLNLDRLVEVEVPEALELHRVKIARTAIDSTCIVSVPKLKVHKIAGVTLGMKNLMGTIMPKGIMHRHIHEKLVDLTRLLKPRITAIDGSYGCERDEISGQPVPMGIVIASRDVVSADAVGAAVMGIDPSSVRHVSLAHDLGLGVGVLDEIEVVGAPIDEVMRRFRQPSWVSRTFRISRWI
ncbi:TPA: DUF362 domain-containing protein [Candidatus Bathyarchaeota archaeon]|nr:DUF362 domain-containing protein [Candidatus Bathyarchaeota archaeon]